MSPNTVVAYARDLTHFYRFLSERPLGIATVGPAVIADFLDDMVRLPVKTPRKRQALAAVTANAHGIGVRRSPASINRTLAAVSSFFEFVILIEEYTAENPVRKIDDRALARVPDRHRPFMGRASRQQPVRRAVRVKTVRALPRPMAADDIDGLLTLLRTKRDRAAILLMLDGGLRPGEVLGIRIPDDMEYGRRRVHVRHRSDHPRGARQKSRSDRVVDLHDPRTLAAVSDYVMHERPQHTGSPYLFLLGGNGSRRGEPLSYQALWRVFSRCCDRLGIRTPWTTPHALRHTHATSMWESGIRELTLQKRLGHVSPESTRLYTRISDSEVLADYISATTRSQPEAQR
ncbi:tyrosine-type recombinase/integrase [Nocardia sp. CA-107356]|uniref:tyrosine-type recombinase/integrase n=1 Tax=Nocardia sp. CA-107356 TaxID=3239972 RepID=UPI003D92B487